MKKINITSLLFMFIGILMLIISFIVYKNNKKFLETAVETEATIENINKYMEYDEIANENRARYDVYISYQTEDGDYYEDVKLGYYNSSMKEGQKLVICYDPENPTDIKSKEGMNIAILILSIIAVGFIFTSILVRIMGAKNKNYQQTYY